MYFIVHLLQWAAQKTDVLITSEFTSLPVSNLWLANSILHPLWTYLTNMVVIMQEF